MDPSERDAVAAICVMAAFADGAKSDSERESLRRILAGMGSDDFALVSERVLMGQTSLEAEVDSLNQRFKGLAMENLGKREGRLTIRGG